MLTNDQARNQARLFGRYMSRMDLNISAVLGDGENVDTALINRLWQHSLRFMDWTSVLVPFERDNYHGCFDEGPLSLEEAFRAWSAGLLGRQNSMAA